jgi:hypothetical protein
MMAGALITGDAGPTKIPMPGTHSTAEGGSHGDATNPQGHLSRARNRRVKSQERRRW